MLHSMCYIRCLNQVLNHNRCLAIQGIPGTLFTIFFLKRVIPTSIAKSFEFLIYNVRRQNRLQIYQKQHRM